MQLSSPRRDVLRRLRRDRSGVALIEFALTLPIVLAIGFSGIEMANLAIANMRVSHAAIDLADNAARMGRQSTSTGYQTLAESDIADAFQALRQEAGDITANGRVTISSVEARTGNSGTGVGNTTQFLHWQRCVGTQSGAGFTSSNGVAPTDDSGVVVSGIGSPTLTAPDGSGLMFVEVNYNYTSIFTNLPIIGTAIGGTRRIHYISAMIVRQTRSTNDTIDNSAGLPRMTCDKFTT